MRVAKNCGPKEHAKQAIRSLRTTYVRLFHYNVHFSPLLTSNVITIAVIEWLIFCCVQLGNCVLCLYFTGMFLPFFLLFNIFIFYICLYITCRVTSYYFVDLLKQPSEVKTLPIAHVPQFHYSRPAAMSKTVRYTISPCSITDHST